MQSDSEPTRSGSEIDAAIDRAFEGAGLRPGDAATTAFVAEGHDPSAVETGDGVGGGDGD